MIPDAIPGQGRRSFRRGRGKGLVHLAEVVFKVDHGFLYQLADGTEFGMVYAMYGMDFFGQFVDKRAFTV